MKSKTAGLLLLLGLLAPLGACEIGGGDDEGGEGGEGGEQGSKIEKPVAEINEAE